MGPILSALAKVPTSLSPEKALRGQAFDNCKPGNAKDVVFLAAPGDRVSGRILPENSPDLPLPSIGNNPQLRRGNI